MKCQIGLHCCRTALGLFNDTNTTRPGVPDYVVVITDGRANLEVNQTIPAANALRAAGIKVFVVG